MLGALQVGEERLQERRHVGVGADVQIAEVENAEGQEDRGGRLRDTEGTRRLLGDSLAALLDPRPQRPRFVLQLGVAIPRLAHAPSLSRIRRSHRHTTSGLFCCMRYRMVSSRKTIPQPHDLDLFADVDALFWR